MKRKESKTNKTNAHEIPPRQLTQQSAFEPPPRHPHLTVCQPRDLHGFGERGVRL